MLEFREIQLSDKPWIDELLSYSDYMGCEYTFANNFAWRRLGNSLITRYKDFYIVSANKNGLSFVFPAGHGDYKDAITQMREYAASKNSPLILTSVSECCLQKLLSEFPGEFTVTADEGSFDYIYNIDDLKNLPGKKYHNKRNHLKKFYEYNWSFNTLTENDFDDCIKFATESYNANNMYTETSAVIEQFAINTFFTNYKELKLNGGVLRVDGNVVGFTIGERLNSNTYCIHIEKALSDVAGAYPAINNEFIKTINDNIYYVNREEDMGIEGLRKAKKSYYPAFMLDKKVVTFK